MKMEAGSEDSGRPADHLQREERVDLTRLLSLQKEPNVPGLGFGLLAPRTEGGKVSVIRATKLQFSVSRQPWQMTIEGTIFPESDRS